MSSTAEFAFCVAIALAATAPAFAATGHRVVRGNAPTYNVAPAGPGIISDQCPHVLVGPPCRTRPDGW